MNIVYFAKGQRGLECLKALYKSRHEVKVVVMREKDDDIEKLAKGRSELFVGDIFKTVSADIYVLAGYNRIVKSPVLNAPKYGVINLHGGKLPEYRGCAPINWQLINGEEVGGCCIHYVDEGIDTGDIILQQLHHIFFEDTHQDIINIQLKLFPKMLLDVLDRIENGAVRQRKQDTGGACYYTRRYPEDSQINWNDTALNTYNLIRAMAGPYPHAFTFYDGRKVCIDKAAWLTEKIVGKPGRIVFRRDNGLVVCCKDKAILVQEMSYDTAEIEDTRGFAIGARFKNE